MSLNLPDRFHIYVLLLTVILTPLVYSAKNVTIQKCCAVDETYDVSKDLCVPSGKTDWNLKIYSRAKKSYLPKNTLPRNWRMKYNSKPWCSSPLTIREHIGNYVVFTNGSLFVLTFESLYHPNDYCLDYNAVRLCKPDSERPLSEVRKCCGFNASFSNTYNGCQIGADVKPKIEIDVLKGQALTIGYPLCNSTEEITLSRISFNSSKFFSNGSLWVPEHQILLPPTRYCLDHIVEHTGKSFFQTIRYTLTIYTNYLYSLNFAG
ncbi:hypothetical protein WA026_010361 [Henosepilachna vigintioctopunctata]|uniref:Uncharacterized protein n=1 Tax=Henosepilachna vigintioctopunctata TaxID=420089 RepID=A0AAW1VE27_9CUCU